MHASLGRVTLLVMDALLSDRIAITREIQEAVAVRDADRLLAHLHPDVEWLPPSAVFGGNRGRGVYHGHAGVRAWLEEFDQGDYTLEPQSFQSVGRGVLVTSDLLLGGVPAAVIYICFAFDGDLIVDGTTIANEAAARARLTR